MDTTVVKYIYPADMLDGDWDEKSGNKHVIVQLSCLCDGTEQTDDIVINLSDLKTPAGNVPSKTAVQWIQYDVVGVTVLLEWDRAPHAEIIRIDGNGTSISSRRDWTQVGGNVDPGGDDRTGDILITTINSDSGDTYAITMSLRLKD